MSECNHKWDKPEPCVYCKYENTCIDLNNTFARIEALEAALLVVTSTIESVDNRCMAADGPVTPTLDEMTQEEISLIYNTAVAALKEATG